MQIVCISDTHGQHRNLELPAGDILIHAGDLTVRGTTTQINDSFEWLAELPYKHKIVVAGNHDFGLERKSQGIKIPSGVIYLENQEVIVEGLKIWGSPVCTPYYDWAFMWDLPRRQELYKTIPDDVDIIVNHGPAFGVLDWTSKNSNAGCEILRERLRQIRPKLFVFGHIHEDYGIQNIDGTIFVNAAILNKQYEIANEAVVIEIK